VRSSINHFLTLVAARLIDRALKHNSTADDERPMVRISVGRDTGLIGPEEFA